VFNCSENVTTFQRLTSFRGLAQVGACNCFDEVNLINVEVLSVIPEKFNSINLRRAWT
jgi:hypothetical protein